MTACSTTYQVNSEPERNFHEIERSQLLYVLVSEAGKRLAECPSDALMIGDAINQLLRTVCPEPKQSPGSTEAPDIKENSTRDRSPPDNAEEPPFLRRLRVELNESADFRWRMQGRALNLESFINDNATYKVLAENEKQSLMIQLATMSQITSALKDLEKILRGRIQMAEDVMQQKEEAGIWTSSE